MNHGHYNKILSSISASPSGRQKKRKSLAVLVDPDKFNGSETVSFLQQLPSETTHLFVGGSTDANGYTEATVKALKNHSQLPVILFPGDHTQITSFADAILFLSLLSGRNPEYLVGQQLKAVEKLKKSDLEVISTGYILVDGGTESAVARVSNTKPLSQEAVSTIVHTAIAGEFMGAKLIYLEAGSGAINPVKPKIISEVKKAISMPLIVGGGIKTDVQKKAAYNAGADMVVMGTVFEN
ncbi:geranylgeranylglyceryl/heptaprenylglyceryl phosphate synthase [Marixanthomonas spongiae]|uniref:Geranylgeranylglyceryl phosphate synthase n=1 Tax=Marixanthomonas spongiae TaxID=2174845 RepID=A0A2U0I8L7_9FLAO|nr:geranylgeranylglyceryl/heptaprenylglyceryl phosphate synthase [Marixanthomonas spongiae]PVW17390.1 geranylgeranylglyceryl/heptaprenylglyceryl phosphate synthase [Marixanthomonas spongiae]